MSEQDLNGSEDLRLDQELPREHRWLGKPGNSHYIPSWYREHRRNVEVRDEAGNGLGFKISDVIPYRRWAVQEDGTILPQLEFEQQYKRYLTGWSVPGNFDPNLKSIPNARAFVSVKLTETGHYVDMFYDPNKKPEARIEAKYNQEGELSEHFLREQREDVQRLSKMETLAKLLRDGLISQETFLRESGLATSAQEGPGEALAPPPEPSPAPVRKTREKRMTKGREEEPAPCGAMVTKGFVKQHQRHCKKCNGLPIVLPGDPLVS